MLEYINILFCLVLSLIIAQLSIPVGKSAIQLGEVTVSQCYVTTLHLLSSLG